MVIAYRIWPPPTAAARSAWCLGGCPGGFRPPPRRGPSAAAARSACWRGRGMPRRESPAAAPGAARCRAGVRRWRGGAVLLGRPVWRAYLPSDHLGLEGMRLQLQPRSPLGGGLVWRTLQTRLSLTWVCLSLCIHRLTLHHPEGGRGRTLWQGYWDVCRPGLVFG